MFIKNDSAWVKDAEKVFRAARKKEDFARLLCGWEPHVGQLRWLNRPANLPNQVLITGRRWGKSEVTAVDNLHYALFHPKSQQAIISITMDQARLSWDRARSFCEASPILKALLAKVRETPFPQMAFCNGSTITVRTAAREGVYVRGHKFDRATVDEADYLDSKVIDDVVRMTLADVGGPLILASTPRAKREMVYELLRKFERGDPSVYAQRGPSFENPHLDHAYINGLRDKLTRDGWKREIEGIYADDDASVFRFDDLRWAYSQNPDGARTQDAYGVVVPGKPASNRRYYAGWDLAKSVDHTVGFVVDATDPLKHRIVYMERTQKMPWPAITARIGLIHKMWGCTETWYDATGIGAYVKDELDGFCTPFVFTKQSKIDILTSLQLQLEKRRLTFPFVRQLVDELQDYEWDDKDLADTDCVMALALAEWQGGGSGIVEVIPSLYD